jgi:hypothetical protein
MILISFYEERDGGLCESEIMRRVASEIDHGMILEVNGE